MHCNAFTQSNATYIKGDNINTRSMQKEERGLRCAKEVLDSEKNFWYTDSVGVGDYYLVYSTNRDADAVTKANWDWFMMKYPQIQDEKDNTFHTLTFAHWAVGWVESLIVRKDADKSILEEIMNVLEGLKDYPIIDDCMYSEYCCSNEDCDSYGCADSCGC